MHLALYNPVLLTSPGTFVRACATGSAAADGDVVAVVRVHAIVGSSFVRTCATPPCCWCLSLHHQKETYGFLTKGSL
eukprot:12915455-Prorocentrum_lima.AAC.1